jgi:hypothetical protein
MRNFAVTDKTCEMVLLKFKPKRDREKLKEWIEVTSGKAGRK